MPPSPGAKLFDDNVFYHSLPELASRKRFWGRFPKWRLSHVRFSTRPSLFVRVARNSPGVVQRERRFWRTSQSMTTGCCWPLLPVRPPRDGAFFVRSPVGVNGATLQENARRRVVGWSFAVTSRLFFHSRGPVGDDGNGRGLSLAGLGICGHQEALPVRRTS